MAKNITLKDKQTDEPLYPITTLGNVISSNGDSISTYINSQIANINNQIANSFIYGNITYGVNTATGSGAITLDGSIPLHVINLSGNVSSVSLSTNPSSGHSCHVIFSASSEYTVAIAHDATNRVCPEAEDISLTIPAGGYAEIDFLSANNKIYVRGV